MAENRNYAMSGALVEGLAAAGLRDVVVCPGSRSGPLAITFASSTAIKTWVHLDERSAGFFALGIAKGSRRPVAVMTTSGTAAANLLPAVVEARLTGVPLIVITADRPPELVDWGANQTIEQTGIYGAHVKWAADLPVPEANVRLTDYASAIGRRAYATAAGYPSGPMHLNVPFREPLAPVTITGEEMVVSGGGGILDDVEVGGAPDGWEAGREVGARLERVQRGLIVCGPQSNPDLAGVVSEAARSLGYPILADPLSQVRCGTHDISQVISVYDLMLHDQGLWERLEPEVVLRFGAWPTSKSLGMFLARFSDARHVLVPETGWPDPHHLASDVAQVDPVTFCRGLIAGGGGREDGSPWLDEWVGFGRSVWEGLGGHMAEIEELFEGKVFREIQKHIPEQAILFAGNSMPVRDMDTFMPASHRNIKVMGNRGASGIDGVISTALGVEGGAGVPVVAVVGDLSFFHDMTGLLMARNSEINATIVVVNNDGGGIFSFLPQAEHPAYFEKVYGTPHGLTFGSVAELYGLEYTRVSTWEEFGEAVDRGTSDIGTSIIEVPSSRERNVVLHREAWSAASDALRSVKRG